MSVLVCQTPCLLLHVNNRRAVCLELHGRGQWKLCIWHFSWTLLCVSLPLADFNLYPFPVLNYNRENNSFQFILWVLVNYQTWWWFWEPLPNLQLVSEVWMVLGMEASNLQLPPKPSWHPTEIRAMHSAYWSSQYYRRAGRKSTPLSAVMTRRHPESI